MIANYTNHAANERTFLAWIRTGLAVAAFGFFLIRLNVFLDAVSGGNILHLAAGDAGAVVAVATRYAGLAMVAIGIAVIARSSFAFERTRRAIDRDEIIQISRSHTESLLSAALAIAVLIFCINLARNQAKRSGSSFRVDSLQPLCRLFGGPHVRHVRQMDRSQDAEAASAVPVVC
jgi:putative membrane protein